MAAEANALLELVTKAVKFAERIRDGWQNASHEMLEFPAKVAILRQKQDDWVSLLKKYETAETAGVKLVLDCAILILDKQVAKFQARSQSKLCGQCVTVGKELIFPGELTHAIESVIQVFQRVEQAMRDRETMKQLFGNAALSQPARLDFSPDEKFVPLVETMTLVKKALESTENKSQVVLLTGGPGEGKTALVRHLALSIQNRETSPAKFEHGVFFLGCGGGADSEALLGKLWQDLGFGGLQSNPGTEETQPNSSSGGLQPTMYYAQNNLREQLRIRLASQKMLIILDDVRETALLEKLLVHGQGVKYLVTTNNNWLWPDAHCVQIRMTRPTSKQAREILANHVPGFPQEIPSYLQEEADTIIEKCDRNPMVLAGVANSIHSESALKLDEWRSKRRYLAELQDGDSSQCVVLFSRTYSKRTISNSITKTWISLSNESQTLLLMGTICCSDEKCTVPEIVLQILFKSLGFSLARFSRCCRELECLSFVKIESVKGKWNNRAPQRSWTIHPMRQKLIQDTRSVEICSMISKLLQECSRNDEKVVSALLFLYANRSLLSSSEQKSLDSWFDHKQSLKWRWAIENVVVWLLHADAEDKLEETSHDCAKKIIQQLMSTGELDKHCMLQLLMVEQLAPIACAVLTSVVSSLDLPNPAFLMAGHDSPEKIILRLIQLIGNDGVQPAPAKLEAIQALSFLTVFADCRALIVAQTKSLESMGSLFRLQDHGQLTFQVYGALILGNLAMDGNAKILIESCPGILEALIQMIHKDRDSYVQVMVMYALRTLSLDAMVCKAMVGIPGALDTIIHLLHAIHPLGLCDTLNTLVNILSCVVAPIDEAAKAVTPILKLIQDSEHANVQLRALKALGLICVKVQLEQSIKEEVVESIVSYLSSAGSSNEMKNACIDALATAMEGLPNKIHIASRCPGVLAGLVTVLTSSDNAEGQAMAANALQIFSADVPENSIMVGQFPNAIEGLVHLLSKHKNPKAQANAAAALADIVHCVKANQIRVGTCPEAVAGLVNLLSRNDNPDGQVQVAAALAGIADGVLENKKKICSHVRAVAGLVDLVSNRDNPEGQEYAAAVLAHIADGVVENQRAIAMHPGAISGLVDVLSNDDNPSAQVNAAAVLAKLGDSDVENRKMVGSHPQAVARLVHLLYKDDYPAGQIHAAAALAAIADGVVVNKRKIGSDPGAVSRLVYLLANHNNPQGQENAAAALANIADGVVQNKRKIASHPGAVSGLTDLLFNHDNPRGQRYAAAAFRDIADGVLENQERIGSYPGAIEGLVDLLSNHDNPGGQEIAAAALVCIVDGVDENLMRVGSCPGAIAGLVGLLSKDDKSQGQANAAKALGILACGVLKNSSVICSFDGALEGLVYLLSKDDNPAGQASAALTLGQIAVDVHANKVKVGLHPGALAGLVNLLAKYDSPVGQCNAATALACIVHGVVENQIDVGSDLRAIAGLVDLLSKDDDPNGQVQAAAALGCIVDGVLQNQIRIVSFAGALQGLVNVLSKDENPVGQSWAAAALKSLAFEVAENKRKMGSYRGVVIGLVNLLSKDDNNWGQVYAADALGVLAHGVPENCLAIGSYQGAIEGLVALLSKDDNSPGQVSAANALGILAIGVLDNSINIGKCSGAIAGLVGLLIKEGNPVGQASAAVALGIIAADNLENKKKIWLYPGAVEALLDLMTGPDGNAELDAVAMPSSEELWNMDTLPSVLASSMLQTVYGHVGETGTLFPGTCRLAPSWPGCFDTLRNARAPPALTKINFL